MTDAGVGALCARSAVFGAYLNVRINSSGLKDKAFVEKILKDGQALVDNTTAAEIEILKIVDTKIK